MAGKKKLRALEAFHDNIADADVLVSYAKAFQNKRSNKMSVPLRDRISEALRIPVKKQKSMDCLESNDLFVVFRDTSKLGPEKFKDLRPLLRPCIVAACAAFETYVSEKVMEVVDRIPKDDTISKRMREIPLTVGEWIDIKKKYTRRQWGIRELTKKHISQLSSTAPNKVGEVLGIIGVVSWSKKIDQNRKCAQGATVKQLESITARRNKIAHSADRQGRNRASLEIKEVVDILDQVKGIVHALDSVLEAHFKLK